MIDETQFMIKYNRRVQDNRKLYGIQTKQIIGQIIEELKSSKPDNKPMTDFDIKRNNEVMNRGLH